MDILLFLILDLGILWLWNKHKKDKSKKLAPIWSWLGPTSVILFFLFALLAGYGTLQLVNDSFPRDIKQTEKELRKIEAAAIKYQSDTGNFPKIMDDLIGKNPTRRDWSTDYWKTPYRLQQQSTSLEIRSAGRDLQLDTADDLVTLVELK